MEGYGNTLAEFEAEQRVKAARGSRHGLLIAVVILVIAGLLIW